MRGENPLHRGLPGEALDGGPQRAQRVGAGRRRLTHDGGDLLRGRGGESRDSTDRAAPDPAVDQHLGPDEDVEPEREIGRERLPRGVTHLEADEVGSDVM